MLQSLLLAMAFGAGLEEIPSPGLKAFVEALRNLRPALMPFRQMPRLGTGICVCQSTQVFDEA